MQNPIELTASTEHCSDYTASNCLLISFGIFTPAKEESYVFTSVCLSVRWITKKVVNGF